MNTRDISRYIYLIWKVDNFYVDIHYKKQFNNNKIVEKNNTIINLTDKNKYEHIYIISQYLSSNKTYKYNSTYLTDSKENIEIFASNGKKIHNIISELYKHFSEKIKTLDNDLIKYKIVINNAISINKIKKIAIIDENRFLDLLNSCPLNKFYLTFILKNNKYETTTEHTFFINLKNEENALINSINKFTNLLKAVYGK